MISYVIILIAVIALAIPSIILVNKFPKSRVPFQIAFTILIVVLGYLLFHNINKPIKFERELKKRTKATVEKLVDIRTIQVAFKDKYGKYTGDFDSLIAFVKTDSFEISSFVTVGEWNTDDMTRKEALDAGIIVKTSSYASVLDSVWNDSEYAIEEIKIIPYTNGKEFTLGAGELVTGSKVKVQVFECYTTYVDLLEDLDKQLLSNYIDKKTKFGGFAGIKVGSLTEATNNAGNWEQETAF
jgi:hypothetical protein